MSTDERKGQVFARPYLERLNGGPLTFARLIQTTRRAEDMSQAEFARRLGISRSHLCDIEKGRKTVSPARAARFARILGYLEEMYVELALQAQTDEAGLRFKVSVEAR